MTVGIKQLNNMFRDFKVAEDVAKMVEMRRFAVEFTVYGSLFLEHGQRRYIISSDKDQIHDHAQQRAYLEQYLLPIMKHTKMTTVPAGCEEDIAQLVKLELACKLRESYSPEFLLGFDRLAQTPAEDSAASILDELADRMQGLYRPDNLLLFIGLMDRALVRKCLRRETSVRYEQWLAQEGQEMANDPMPRDRFHKTLYGLASRKAEGPIKVYYNAEKSKMIDKKAQLTAQGQLTTPLYAKTYWYNYDRTLGDVRREFEQYLQELFDETYFTYLARIEALPSVIDPASFDALLQKCQQEGDTSACEALHDYQARWGVRL